MGCSTRKSAAGEGTGFLALALLDGPLSGYYSNFKKLTFMNIRLISLCLFILIIDSCTRNKIKPEVTALRCEYSACPVGMDVLSPRLSWQMKKDVRGARQTAYRIMVATGDE